MNEFFITKSKKPISFMEELKMDSQDVSDSADLASIALLLNQEWMVILNEQA